MGTVNSFLGSPRAQLCSFLSLNTPSAPLPIFLLAEQCPPSQQEGLKLEHRSDLFTNVTGECPSHPAIPSTFSLEWPVVLLACPADSTPAVSPKGFNLIRRLNFMKISAIKKIRNPNGPLILRLGAAPLTQPTR